MPAIVVTKAFRDFVKMATSSFAGAGTVVLEPNYERIVAICRRADGVDVSRWLVANGYAIDWPKYSKGRYAVEQQGARSVKSGVWQGGFALPCVFRAAHRNNGQAC